ncbi:MAG TPA: 2-oxoacid:acceptor oxidoreductase subunit alpha [Planctomycetota bacterium]|jgi:2-oxoglutarate ferredoxin oxidoreductase subunit alpha|nr:2-oxoacid:acceptor oxidoreductase subunit alpha [Planctomycetota bacterium]
MSIPPQASVEDRQQMFESVVIRFAGDSGDGMQITGNQFTQTSALFGNDLATFPDFPAEIRAPAGTRPGVSGFQIRFASTDIHTPGDAPDVLVAMNPAALVVNIHDLKPGGILIVNTGQFKDADLAKAKIEKNPLTDGSLSGYRVIQIDINKRVTEALAGSTLSPKEVQRCKNFYTLGLMYWLYNRSLEPTLKWLADKFAKTPEFVEANQKALRAGYNAGDIHEMFQGRYEVPKCETLPKGTYRNMMGNQAVAMGLVAGAERAGLKLFFGSYPITPASGILEQLAAYKNYGVLTMQAEDEIAAVCSAIGAAFAGHLGATATSGPGVALKQEGIGLAIAIELPLVIVDVQRGGPSTGLPTKTEQADLLQVVFGRNSEAWLPVVACATPSDAFDCAVEACRIAVQFMTPVVLLSDGYIANGSEPWKLPEIDDLPSFPVQFRTDPKDFLPYSRDSHLARPWVKPGTPGLEHRIGGLEKEHLTGNISYDPENHEFMVKLRAQKVMAVRDTIPTPEVHGAQKGKVLVLGWGSTQGTITSAVEKLHAEGVNVARMHLRHVWPLPHGLDEIFSRYSTILVPEMNLGQMVRILRSEYPHQNFVSYPKVQGQPFQVHEIKQRILTLMEK